MASSRPHRLGRIVLALIAAALSLVAAEAALRYRGGFDPPPARLRPTRADLYHRFEPHGYRLFPSRTVTYQYPQNNPRTLTLTSNRDGFRGRRELDEADDRFRIMVVGDSFVFGQGVEEEERFTDVLEAQRPDWRIDNLGMTGYGADLMLMALEHVGLRTQPDVVVFCMYTDDFRRLGPRYSGVGYRIPRFRLKSGELVREPFPELAPWDRLHLAMALRRSLQRDEDVMFAFDLNQAILERFLSHAEPQSFLPAIVFLPGRGDSPMDRERRHWLGRFAADRNVPFLDLTEALLVEVGSQDTFIPDNWHLNPRGHAIVAGQLRTFIEGEVIERVR